MAGLLRAARPGAVALAGRPSERAARIAADAGVELVDYYARPELVIRNAIPTAEGCIGILLEKRPRTLWGARVGGDGVRPGGAGAGPAADRSGRPRDGGRPACKPAGPGPEPGGRGRPAERTAPGRRRL